MADLPLTASGSAALARGPARLGLAPWRVGCWIIALAVAAPLIGVFANLAAPGGEALRHLAATTLPEILLNTLGSCSGSAPAPRWSASRRHGW
jgi:ABC-type Fe3+ transport system permease subunit